MTKAAENKGATLVSLRIDRRLARGSDCEVWIIDGATADGAQVSGVGELAITQEASGDFIHAIGGVRFEHKLDVPSDLTDMLIARIGDLGHHKGWLFFNWSSGSIDLDWER